MTVRIITLLLVAAAAVLNFLIPIYEKRRAAKENREPDKEMVVRVKYTAFFLAAGAFLLLLGFGGIGTR